MFIAKDAFSDISFFSSVKVRRLKRIDDTVNSERSADHGQPHHVHAICNHEIASRPRDKLGLTRYDSNNRIEDSCVLRLYVLTPSQQHCILVNI